MKFIARYWQYWTIATTILAAGFTGGTVSASIAGRAKELQQQIDREKAERAAADVATDEQVRLLREEFRQRTDRIIEILGGINRQVRRR